MRLTQPNIGRPNIDIGAHPQQHVTIVLLSLPGQVSQRLQQRHFELTDRHDNTCLENPTRCCKHTNSTNTAGSRNSILEKRDTEIWGLLLTEALTPSIYSRSYYLKTNAGFDCKCQFAY
jgi:hypothetical protein